MSSSDSDFEDTLRTFLTIVNDHPSPRLHTYKEIEEIFERSIDKVKKFYTKFVHTTKTLEQYVNVHMSKVYIRLYKPTGNWYIGFTDQEYADNRHDQDLSMSKTRPSTKLLRFYNDVLRTDDSREDNIVVYTIAELKDTKSAKTLEKKLICHFTNPNIENNVLPVELCLNTEDIYYEKEPPSESRRLRDEQRRDNIRRLMSPEETHSSPEERYKTILDARTSERTDNSQDSSPEELIERITKIKTEKKQIQQDSTRKRRPRIIVI
jgi:hypothetical protein